MRSEIRTGGAREEGDLESETQAASRTDGGKAT